MKIASWNVNSLNVRLSQVLAWLESAQPDILALQEIKMENAKFPIDIFQKAGFHVCFNGQKTYNGVALISRLPFEDIACPDFDEQHRILAATLGNLRLINLYVPNGEAVTSPKYIYKLKWLNNLKKLIVSEKINHEKLVILGDFNIAPHDADISHPENWEGSVLCSLPERTLFQEILSLGLVDSFRLFPQLPHSYSWWDYRMMGFKRNAGLRIDLILISDKLKENCTASYIDKIPRSWERPSDHTPVIIELSAC